MRTRESITVEEFKDWLMQFDDDNDGRISWRELREAIRRRGAWFAGLRARFAVRDGYVDMWNTEHLIELAEKLGFTFIREEDYYDTYFVPTKRPSPSPSAAPATVCTPPPAAAPLHFPQHIYQPTHPSPSTGPNSDSLLTQHLATTDLLLRLLPRG